MSVLEYGSDTPGSRYLLLQHGRITHGFQLTDPTSAAASRATTASRAAWRWPSAISAPEKRIGVVGLGTARRRRSATTVIMSALRNQLEVLRIATSHFTFIKDTRDLGGKVDVIMGDARLSMESRNRSASMCWP